jgi:hypothetical protein
MVFERLGNCLELEHLAANGSDAFSYRIEVYLACQPHALVQSDQRAPDRHGPVIANVIPGS